MQHKRVLDNKRALWVKKKHYGGRGSLYAQDMCMELRQY